MRPKPVDLKKIKKILVCMFKYHGDVLLISSFLTALKNHLPAAQIDCIVFSETKDMLEGHPSINNLILYKKEVSHIRRLYNDFSHFYKVRKGRYDLAFNMSQGDRGALFCMFSGAKIRVGFDSLGKGFYKKNNVYTHLVGITSSTRHVVDINLDPLRIIGINPMDPADRALHLTINENEKQKVASLLKEFKLVNSQFVVIHAMSRYEHKNWPSKKWAELIEGLQEKGVKVVLSGGPCEGQKRISNEILAFLRSQEGVYNFCGKTSLKGLAALINESRLLVTVDSVPLHISSALKKPVVALFGPSIEHKWGPYRNCQARVVAMNLPCRSCNLEGCGNSWISDCMQHLSSDKVRGAVFDLLESKTIA